MRKEFGVALIALFFLSLNAITGAYAVEETTKVKKSVEKEYTILSKNEDVSGDGKPDKIKIKGIRYEEGSDYLKEVYLDIFASNGEKFQTTLDSGFDPDLKLVDLNHDGIKDMYISIPTGGSGGISNYFLFTLKDSQLTDIGIPDPVMITSEFEDGYKANITIEDTGKSYTFDLINRKKEYDELGLYIDGKLNEPRELMVDPYGTLKPVILENKKYGLKGIQQVSGAYHADSIAFVESTWLLEDGKWNLMDTKVLERRKTSSKKD